MLNNYFKIAWRNLMKNRTFSIINIVGLSFSVAFCLLLFFYIRHEQSYDSFHVKKNRLFRMEMSNMYPSPDAKQKDHLFSFLTKSDDVENGLGFPLTVGPDMQKVFPEIKSITRFQSHVQQLVKANKAIYNKTRVLYADDNFFSNFSFHIKKGNAKTALRSINNVVISESAAKKYFGKAEAIGKTIELVSDSVRLFMVAAIAEDAPANSSIQYDVVVPLMADPGYAENIEQRFNQNSHLLVIELNENISAAQFENKLNEWAKKYFAQPFVVYGQSYTNKIDANFHWHLRPLTDCHYNVSGPWGHYTNAKNIYQLACLVIIILLIASLNYVLLVISNAASRSQEVGVRKVMGANRRAIILQFWVETQIVVVIAVIIGLALTSLMLPLFNSIIGSDLNFTNFSWKEIIPALLILCVALGIIAGYYPALIISKMKVVLIIKSFQTFKINPRFSKVMVVLQYTACVVLMISAFIISRQMNYINNKDLGFDKEQVLMVTNPTWDSDFSKRTRNLLLNFAKTQPYITQFSGMNGGLDGGYDLNGFKLNGEQKWRKEISVDYNYFDMLGIKFLQGRPFSSAIASDTSIKMRPVIVNETLFNMLGKTAKLGQYCEPIYSTIIGVVKNYHFETLSKKIEPQEHRLATGYESYFMFKIKAGQTQQAISKIEKEWKSITEYPFEYTFLDQTITKMYDADMRWQKTIEASSFFAIFIACMGLFGLSAINAINRTKEVGIRKVLGASVKEIVVTLSSNFLIMVAIAIIIATPLAWWIMNKWLEDFAYRITISWWMFVLVGASAILIAFATVSFQAIKAALVNPVKSLKNE
ncbi:MAG: ABC transporter permease [Bacteroidetes bacterium]|nr:ABC transporter permease [Bacteroidota bacterium]